MADGNFLAGFQDNLGWLQQVPDWLNNLGGGGAFDTASAWTMAVKLYGNYMDLAIIGAVGILSYYMYVAWVNIREEV